MAILPLIISKSKAFSDFKDLKIMRDSSSLLVIVTKVLLQNKVIVQQKPSDIECTKTWIAECDKACSAFNRILKDVKKKKSPGDTAFFDLSQYTVFAKVQRPKLEAKRGAREKVISPEIKASEYRLFKERAQPVREVQKMKTRCIFRQASLTWFTI